MQQTQPRLVGKGAKKRREAFAKLQNWGPDGFGKYSEEALIEFCKLLCDEIKQERRRIGGDWVVPWLGLSAKVARDAVRLGIDEHLVGKP